MNKMDREGVSWQHCVKSIRERLYVDTLLVQIPIGHGSLYNVIIDLFPLSNVK